MTEHLQHPRLPHAAGQGLGAASPAAGTAPHRVAPHRGGGLSASAGAQAAPKGLSRDLPRGPAQPARQLGGAQQERAAAAASSPRSPAAAPAAAPLR